MKSGVNVTTRGNQLPRDGSMTFLSSNEQRRVPILHLKINVTASFNQLLRNGSMPVDCRDVERRASILVLKINDMRACRRQQCPNSHCISITRLAFASSGYE
jgi:ethanolamine utilization protein EutQ (cupin superfamily)